MTGEADDSWRVWAVRWGVGPNSPPPPHPTRHIGQGGASVQAQYKHVSCGEWRGWAPLAGLRTPHFSPVRMRALLLGTNTWAAGVGRFSGAMTCGEPATRVNGRKSFNF